MIASACSRFVLALAQCVTARRPWALAAFSASLLLIGSGGDLWGQPLVINEIDYDQPGTDAAEFIEIRNNGAAPVDLSAFSLQLVNGTGGGAAVYQTIALPAVSLAAGDYFVVCGDAATTANCDLDVSPDTNLIQNGAPDAVALLQGTTLIDTVSYEGDTGAPYTEGSGVGLEDDPGMADMGISRCPDGTDTNQNNVDLTFVGITPGAANDCAPAAAQLVINEIDYDQPGTDAAEFIEIRNNGAAPADLSAFSLQLVNGSGGGAAVYQTIALPAVSLAAGDYFVVCGDAATTANCDLDVSPDTNLIQNGAPDAVALLQGATLIDTVSYEGDTGAPYTEGSGAGLEDDPGMADMGISRCPDGTDTNQNNVDLTQAPITPGVANSCAPAAAQLVINEIDYDQPGTDAAEFVEIRNNGATPVDLSAFSLQLVNGTGGGAAVYQTIALPAVSLAAGDYFVVCGNAATTANCDLDVSPDTNLIQNGAPDAVALLRGTTLIDTVSYEGDTGAPYTEGSGAGLEDPSSGGVGGPNDNKSISRFPDGIDTSQNNVDLSTRCATPGGPNTLDFENCPSAAPAALVINEIDYDQPGTDAAEFVEIRNNGAAPVDLSAFSLQLVNGSGGGAAVYQTIALPAVSLAAGDYFVVCANAATTANCDLDVSPDTNLIQNGAPDAVALLQGATLIDTVSYEGDTGAPYTEGSGVGLEDSGSTGQDFRGISRFPDGTDTDQNNVDLRNACITPGGPNTSLSTGCSPLAPVREIFEIQGTGASTPFDGQLIRTVDNAVTALAPNGFFMQTPAARRDSDVDTSDGIFVFTGGAPGVSVGDQVDVTGPVTEFFDFTEFSVPLQVTVTGGGAIPPAVIFDAAVPSPDPTSPSCGIEFECYEGMLIEIADGTVTGPNQRFGTDPIAEVHITAAPARTFREPGIEFPGIPGFAVWDGNPEVFELDPDKLGLPNQIIPAGSSFAAVGVLGFEFGGYELWPTQLTVTEPVVLPRSVRSRAAGELTVATLNMFRFFDDVDDPPDVTSQGEIRDDMVVSTAEYLRRRAKLASHILEVLDAPDILAVQEVEKLGVLQDLAAEIALIDPTVVYSAYLEEGNDVGTIDVGFLVRDTIAVDAVTQLGKEEILTFDGSLLNDRPPLLLQGRCLLEFGSYPIAVLTVHNRSLGGIDDPVDGARIRQKRLEQAESVARKVQDLQVADPDIRLLVIGDFNAFEFSDGYVDVIGHIRGDFDPTGEFVCSTNPCPDLVHPDLANQIETLPQEERYSFIFSGSAQVLDHGLASQMLAAEISGAEYGRGNADAAVDLINDGTTSGNIPLRTSDHDGLVVFVLKDEDADGVPNDLDVCPGTVIPESVPTSGQLNPNHWALVDGDTHFDTRRPPGGGNQASFTTGDTGGCSCEQIIAALGLGKGHLRHGCSTGVMRTWVDMVNN